MTMLTTDSFRRHNVLAHGRSGRHLVPLFLALAPALGCSGGTGSGSNSSMSPAGGASAATAGVGNLGGGNGGNTPTSGDGPGGSSPGTTGGAVASGGVGGAVGGGAGGGGSAPIPHEVGECNDLGQVGEWQEITPPTNDPGDFVLDPRHAGTLYVGSELESNGVWKTTDCGSTWQKVSTGPGSEDIEAGRQTTFKIDPVTGTLYTNSLYGHDGVYKSTNGGVDWQNVTPSGQGMHGFIGHIDIDPEDGNHLLALFHAACTGDGNGNDEGGCIGETRDGGATWTAHYHTPSFPGEVMGFFLHGDTWAAGANEGLVRTTDAGASWTVVSSNGAGGHSTRPPYRTPNGAYFVGTGDGVLYSPPGSDGASWSIVGEMAWLLGTTGDGKNVYIAGNAGVWTAPQDDPENWTLMPGSPSHSDGCTMDPQTFDHDHHLLYVSCFGADGMWRVRTQ